ncbi:MAG: FixH family protein [Phycisphaerales bacterium JB052]
MTPKDSSPKRGFLNLGKHWPFVIVLMLLAHASLMIGTIVYVGGKHDTFVDPDYYAKSVDWDSQREMKEAVEREGWKIDLRTEFVDDDASQRVVEFQLVEMDGTPIEDAIVELVCYHPSELSNRLDAVLVHDQDGVYTRELPIERTGIWVAELTIQRQGIKALMTRDLDVISMPTTANP